MATNMKHHLTETRFRVQTCQEFECSLQACVVSSGCSSYLLQSKDCRTVNHINHYSTLVIDHKCVVIAVNVVQIGDLPGVHPASRTTLTRTGSSSPATLTR